MNRQCNESVGYATMRAVPNRGYTLSLGSSILSRGVHTEAHCYSAFKIFFSSCIILIAHSSELAKRLIEEIFCALGPSNRWYALSRDPVNRLAKYIFHQLIKGLIAQHMRPRIFRMDSISRLLAYFLHLGVS